MITVVSLQLQSFAVNNSDRDEAIAPSISARSVEARPPRPPRRVFDRPDSVSWIETSHSGRGGWGGASSTETLINGGGLKLLPLTGANLERPAIGASDVVGVWRPEGKAEEGDALVLGVDRRQRRHPGCQGPTTPTVPIAGRS
jgi:hypothetical protein